MGATLKLNQELQRKGMMEEVVKLSALMGTLVLMDRRVENHCL